MADNSYRPRVYRAQGGDELTVATGGNLNIDGGSFNVPRATATGGSVTINAGGSVTFATGSTFKHQVRTATQTLTLDESYSGGLVVVTQANKTLTLPNATTSDGVNYNIVLGTTALAGVGATGLHIRHQGTNKIHGGGLNAATTQSVVLLGSTDNIGDSLSLTADASRAVWWITNAVGGWSVITAT